MARDAAAVDVGDLDAEARQAVAAFAEALRHYSGEERHLVSAAILQFAREAVARQRPPDAGELVWGALPTGPEAAEAAVANLRLEFERRREVEAQSVPPEEIAALLGVSVAAVMTMIAGHRLVVLKKGQAWLVPGWQLDPDGEQGILPGIDRAWAAFPAGVVPFCRWMTRPSVDLDDRTPRDVLAAGDVDTVAQLAEQLTAAGW